MKAARRAIAFFSGALLYCCGIGVAMQYAAIGLPRSLYAQLGGRNSMQVLVGEALALAGLLFLLAAVWAYLTMRPARRRHRPYVAWMMSGVGVAWAGWLIFGAFTFALKPRSYSAPLQTMLLSSGAPPLFGALNVLGVIGGVWVAGALATRRQLSLPTTRSRQRPNGDATDAGDSSVAPLGPHTGPPPH
jgi:hypothetical protein